MNKKAFQTAGSTLIIGLFLFFAFASTEETANTIRPESNYESLQNQNTTAPSEQNCYKCNGFGEYNTEAPSGFVNKTVVCEVCNGTGKASI
jgi:DnaJ-class molecular chaperone